MSDLGTRLDIVGATGSTNADLLARLRGGEDVGEGYWLIADRQERGRGRQGRLWLDGQGNFMGSTIVRLAPRDPSPATLSFVSALAVLETLRPLLADQRALQLKWPNDLMLDGAKLCGILLEREGDRAVIGIGVNLAAAPVLPDRMAGSVSVHADAPDRDRFAQDLAENFARELARWRDFGTNPIFSRWLSAAHPVGAALSVHDEEGRRISGTFDGLEPDGALRLRLPDGLTRAIHAGDVMLEVS